MTATLSKYKAIIEYLLYAERDVHEVMNITEVHPELTLKDAYTIQSHLVNKRLEENTTKTIGVKLDLTSASQQSLYNVKEPVYGFLHADMLVKEWEPIDCSNLIHPRAEAEIAFFIGADLQGDAMTEEDVLQSVTYIAPAIEIVDSRYKDFQYTVVDTVADNCAAAKFIIGSKFVKLDSINLRNTGMVLSKNGRVECTGTTAEVLDNPLSALLWIAKKLCTEGRGLKKGDVILSGAITEAIPVCTSDTIVAEFDGLGSVIVTCE